MVLGPGPCSARDGAWTRVGRYHPPVHRIRRGRRSHPRIAHPRSSTTARRSTTSFTPRAALIQIDEPTDLPNGTELYLVSAAQLEGGDDLDDEERAALHGELEASMAGANAGELVDFDVVLAELRSPS